MNAAPAQLHALQRFGSTVNLHIHDHAVVSDGAFALEDGRLRFYPAREPSPEELRMLVESIRRRILKRMTVMGAVPDAAIAEMLSWPHSGFSLNADVRIEADDRAALERLLHYVLRPALSLKKLSYHPAEENVRYRPDKGRPGFPKLLEWSPLEFLERFAAIIPPPRKHLVRYYGALGPRSKIRRALTCAAKAPATCEELLAGFAVEGLLAVIQSVSRSVREAATKAASAWAACLKRIFEVDPVQCVSCGGEMKLVAMIVEDDEIERILKHSGQPTNFPLTARPRSPPLPFGVESREDSQEDRRCDDDRQDWPDAPGSDLPA